MKKLILLFLMLFGISSLMIAQVTVHLSGTVLRDSTNLPVVGHEVIIMADSNVAGFNFWAQRFTTHAGFYDCTISNVPAGVQTFIVKTKDCDSTYIVKTFQTSNSPVIENFVICSSPPPNCEADFFSHADTLNTLNIHFQNISIYAGEITSFLWHFGDGHTATTPDPWHLYATAGTYSVCLTIATSTGCTSTICKELHVTQTSAGCEARFEYAHDTLNSAPYAIHFFDTSTGTPTTWEWHFGDPTSGSANVSHDKNPTHIYQTAGAYTVCLSIHTYNCQASKCDSIHVGTIPSDCSSHFTFNKNFLTVNFESHITSNYPTTYSWNFGDPASGNSNFSTEPHTHHLFSAPGSFTVTLTTVTSNGCTWSSTQTIWVNATCDINGRVNMGNTFVDHGLIELIRVDSGGVMTVVSSHEFGDSLGMYWFGGVLPGHYFLLAQLLPSSSRWGNFVPTYFEEAINWTNAHQIELGQPNNPYNFHLIETANHTPGNGTIGGTITQGTKNASGTPAQNVEVLLLNSSNQPLGVVMTDASGHFEFNNMSTGSYIVYPEVVGMITTPANITLDNEHTSATSTFTINSTQIVYGINEQLPQYISSISDIYPNPPTNGIANLNVTVTRELDLILSLNDQTGKEIHEFHSTLHKGDNILHLNTGNLAKGPYYLKIHTSNGGFIIRKLVIVK